MGHEGTLSLPARSSAVTVTVKSMASWSVARRHLPGWLPVDLPFDSIGLMLQEEYSAGLGNRRSGKIPKHCRENAPPATAHLFTVSTHR